MHLSVYDIFYLNLLIGLLLEEFTFKKDGLIQILSSELNKPSYLMDMWSLSVTYDCLLIHSLATLLSRAQAILVLG